MFVCVLRTAKFERDLEKTISNQKRIMFRNKMGIMTLEIGRPGRN
jgi:hypothetical protein